MKLYFAPGVCSLSPHIVLRALGLPVTLEKVDIRAQPHVTEHGVEFSTINPKGSVPALLLDDGELLTEGAVIVQYLADLVPEKGLLPVAGTFARYRAQEMLNFISTEVHKGFSGVFRATTDQARDDAWAKLDRPFGVLEPLLSKQPYLLGESFSVADAYLFTCLGWAHVLHRSLDAYPALQAFAARVRELPFVQEALKAEGLIK